MKALAITPLITAALLAGCATPHVPERAEPTIAERVEYVIKLPPAELLQLPPPPPPIDVDTATQADVARWLAANEEWMRDMQNRLREIAAFLKGEQLNLEKLANEFNEKQGTSGNSRLVIKQEPAKKK